MSDDLCLLSATRLARMICQREVSSLEVVDACLTRIDHVNPKLNAVVQIAPDARDRAANGRNARDDASARSGVLWRQYLNRLGAKCANAL